MKKPEFLGKNALMFLWSMIEPLIESKVAKVEGMGLSDNNLTAALKSQYDKAQENVLESIKVNGVTVTPTAKAVNVTVPTTEDINTLINTAIGGIAGFSFEIVQTLPATGEGNKIYLLPKEGPAQNIYTEYIWVSEKWEKIGETDIDLSDYLRASDIVEISNSEIEAIING